MNKKTDDDYNPQWDQWPPIEGDDNEGAHMLRVVLIGMVVLLISMAVYGLTQVF